MSSAELSIAGDEPAQGSLEASDEVSDGPLLRLRYRLEDVALSKEYREVEDRDGDVIAAAIEQVMISAARSILAGDGFEYVLPSRGATDQVYLEELDRIVLKNKTTKANFATVSSVRKVTILTRVMQLVHQVVTVTLRWRPRYFPRNRLQAATASM